MEFTGIVQVGNKKASELGFPTLNIPLTDETLSGVYFGTVNIDGEDYYGAIFANTARNLLEAHLLDFTENAYGKEITISIIKKIREHLIFADDELLREAIAHDIAVVRKLSNT